MNRNVARMMALAAAGAMVLAAAGCSGNSGEAVAASTEETSAILVSVEPASRGNLELNTSFVGTVQPDQMVSVIPKVSGTVEKVNFQPGDTVKKGELLFQISTEDLMTSVRQAQAAYRSAAAQVDQMTGSSYKSSLQQLDTAFDTAYENYQDASDKVDECEDSIRDLEKYIAGFPVGGSSISATSEDDDQMTLEEAQEKLAELKASLPGLKTSEDYLRKTYNNAKNSYNITMLEGKEELDEVAAATLEQAQVALDAAMETLDHTKLYAPIDGVVESVSVTEMNMASTGSPAFIISNKSAMTITFDVSSDAVMTMKIGDSVAVEKSGKEYEAVVTEVGTMVNGQTGLFTVKATLTQEAPELLTGLTVKVTAPTQKADDALLVSQDAVYYEDGDAYLYLLKDGVVTRVDVETGISNEEQVEILSGITDGDPVITSWNPNMVDGVSAVAAQ